MAADLDLPVEVVPCPTVREPDGLAMSSRNMRLPSEARAAAATLYRVLTGMAADLGQGAALADLRPAAEAALQEAGFDRVEYLDLRAARDLAPLDRAGPPARLLAAAWLGGVRLIDNIAVG